MNRKTVIDELLELAREFEQNGGRESSELALLKAVDIIEKLVKENKKLRKEARWDNPQ